MSADYNVCRPGATLAQLWRNPGAALVQPWCSPGATLVQPSLMTIMSADYNVLLVTGWPGIAVPPGSAHFPTQLRMSTKYLLNFLQIIKHGEVPLLGYHMTSELLSQFLVMDLCLYNNKLLL